MGGSLRGRPVYWYRVAVLPVLGPSSSRLVDLVLVSPPVGSVGLVRRLPWGAGGRL